MVTDWSSEVLPEPSNPSSSTFIYRATLCQLPGAAELHPP
jgi:hypothetical protein